MISFCRGRLPAFLVLIGIAATTAVAEAAPEPQSEFVKLRKPGSRQAAPEVNSASNEATLALKRMKLVPGLQASLWAAEPMLAHPVAIAFDERGRLFIAESYRYQTSVLDVRSYMAILEDDLACRTIEDRSALIARRFGPEGVRELSIEDELVRLVEDTKGTGRADRSMVYASGFNSPLDGVASGILARRDKVWFANIPSLWQLTGEAHADSRVELSRGYGVRFNYLGHDLHGLTFGPDGKIYFSIGDRGAHVPTTEGGVVDVPDTGAVFRCNPDGTRLELFAWGLRNPQSLFFTENGDLFTGDNDCDQGDEERLVHVVENGDSGWRVGYQYPPLGRGSPWLADKLWYPRHEEQAAYIIPPICNIEDGPSGIAYYPGTGLNPSYAGTIFITHFRGSVVKSGIYTYNIKPNGATYAITDSKPFLTSALPTDVKFGPDGRLYYADWGDGWDKSHRGRIYAIFDPQHVNDPAINDTRALIASDPTRKSLRELDQLLAHPDWRVRLDAQYELASRGVTAIPALAHVAADGGANALARRHAVWGLGQIAARDPAALAPLRKLIADRDSEVRAQTLKLLGDLHAVEMAPALIEALRDADSRVRFFAAQSLGKLKHAAAAPALLAALRANDDRDNYLRHALVMGLVGGRNLAALSAAITDESRAVRLGVLLTLRRLCDPAIARFLSDHDPFLVREAGLAINDAPIDGAFPALAALLDHPNDDVPLMQRVINAQFRLGQSANATALGRYVARADAPASLRAEALAQLALWSKPPARDRLVGVYRPQRVPQRPAAPAAEALGNALPILLDRQTPEAVQTAALVAIQSLEIKTAADALVAVIGDDQQPAKARAAALEALDQLRDARLATSVKRAGQSQSPALRLAALPIAARLSPDAAAPTLARFAAEGNVAEQKAALVALGTLPHPTADRVLAEQLRRLAKGEVAPAVQLELLTAARQRSDPTIKNLLAEHDAAVVSGDPLAAFGVSLEGGDRQNGQKIFTGHPVLACVRCHRNGSEAGGDAGPNLAGVGARYSREYLLESVVRPNAKIAPGFDTIVVSLKTGAVHAGIVASESDTTLALRTPENAVVELRKTEIAKREGAPSSMPEIYANLLTSAELRDVVEFLASLKQKPVDESGRPVRALRLASRP